MDTYFAVYTGVQILTLPLTIFLVNPSYYYPLQRKTFFMTNKVIQIPVSSVCHAFKPYYKSPQFYSAVTWNYFCIMMKFNSFMYSKGALYTLQILSHFDITGNLYVNNWIILKESAVISFQDFDENLSVSKSNFSLFINHRLYLLFLGHFSRLFSFELVPFL